MQNEGIIERSIQITISVTLLMTAFFWTGGIWQKAFFLLSFLIGIFSVIGFCPLYVLFRKKIFCPVMNLTKRRSLFLCIYTLILLGIGSYGSIFFTKKIFGEDFQMMNTDYKQTLFETGQEKQLESKENYEKLVISYALFEKKYRSYRPYSLRGDALFDTDLKRVEEIILSVKKKVDNGDLREAHLELETIRPITQDILKRNNFSLLAIALVDFHDSMEKILDKANIQDAPGVIMAYDEASLKLSLVEQEAADVEIQTIRKNLDDLLRLAKDGRLDQLEEKAGELKKSFVRVYLARG
ncbi:MAG: DUF2892 domain-containing protein [Candidatus Moranbacteria bacterium]|jgi:hypothetical protein|nr:DUF2892 domain-containing protein [Candidatus Moranbacteria bacterium]MBP9801637.1 DUF2892 domain-containing protein [Candidatus Moranbacteria bacterium]